MGRVDTQGKVAMVAGGARGVGRVIVRALAGARTRVDIADRRHHLMGQVISVSGGLTLVG
jgi:NAD(P)-dependent dehydrogenase (short-subunit alcohol dehydrogenase family)